MLLDEILGIEHHVILHMLQLVQQEHHQQAERQSHQRGIESDAEAGP